MNSQPRTDGLINRNRFVWLFAGLLVFYILRPILQHLRGAFHPAVPTVAEGILLLALLVGTVVAVRQAWILFALLLAMPALVLWLIAIAITSEVVDVIHHCSWSPFSPM